MLKQLLPVRVTRSSVLLKTLQHCYEGPAQPGRAVCAGIVVERKSRFLPSFCLFCLFLMRSTFEPFSLITPCHPAEKPGLLQAPQHKPCPALVCPDSSVLSSAGWSGAEQAAGAFQSSPLRWALYSHTF